MYDQPGGQGTHISYHMLPIKGDFYATCIRVCFFFPSTTASHTEWAQVYLLESQGFHKVGVVLVARPWEKMSEHAGM